MKKSILLSIAALSVIACKQNVVNDNDKYSGAIEELLCKMTLEEKIGQMNQISSWGVLEGEQSDLIRAGYVGSILNEVDPSNINAMQRMAVEQSRLGIPIIFSRDVIHGFKTIFPIPLAQAATFNPELVEQCAKISAIEATASGIRWTFSPMIDISRDPRWGRVAEGAGEDTYLSSVMGVAMIRGYQGNEGEPTSMAACPKHFIGYGASESGRDYNSTYIPERQMRNVYLPPFKAAIEAGAYTIMTSFNDNDGIPCTGNGHIINNILRDEWGFDGLVVSDWCSVTEMIPHGFCKDPKDAALKGVNAGVQIDMVSNSYLSNLKDLVSEKNVNIKTIDNAVRDILRIKFRLGLFDNPYVDESKTSGLHYSSDNLQSAKQCAIESIVLLKNKNRILPVNDKVKTVLITGPLADAPYEQMGTWAFDGEKERVITPLTALKNKFEGKINIIYEPGLSYSRDKNNKNFSSVMNAARQADLILAFVGEEAILSGEAHSLADISLVGAQSELIDKLKDSGKPLVTVFMAGRPLTIEKESELSDAVIYAWHPGTMGGEAIAEILTGEVSPSGKLPVTFPRMVGQIPIYYNNKNTGRPANRNETLIDDIAIEAGQTSLGCTSFWLDAGFDALYPFGFGLSYTDFVYDDLKLDKETYTEDETLSLSFTLANAGDYDATEVVQLYIRDKVASITRPVKELKGFKRVNLAKGEEKRVSMQLKISDLAFYNDKLEKVVEPGEFDIWVGPNSAGGLLDSFDVK